MKLRLWFLLSILFKCLDIFTTIYIIGLKGIRVESNPFVLNMMFAYGTTVGLFINAIIFCMLMWVLLIYNRLRLIKISTIFMIIVVCINIINILT
jgi:cytochrome bd-type quinol oxidase subunit 1